MKAIMRITLMFAFFATLSVSASEPKITILKEADASVFVLKLKPSGEKSMIRLYDPEGQILFSDTQKSDKAYAKKLNMSLVDDGEYVLEVENAQRVTTYTLEVADGSVTYFMESDELVKTVFRSTEDRVFLNLLNLHGHEVSLKVYNSSNSIVFEDTINDSPVVQKAFNFEKAVKGTYTVVVNDGENTYSQLVVAD